MWFIEGISNGIIYENNLFFLFYLQNGDRLFIGAPGSWYWQGKLNAFEV